MATRKRDPLYRIACHIHRQLERTSKQPSERFRRLSELSITCRSIAACWESGQRACHRGWHLAAERRYRAASEQLSSLQSQASIALWQDSSPVPLPGIPLLLEELKQIHQEFEDVKIDCRTKRITVTTPRIILEEVDLGPFGIELRLDELADHRGSRCFRCIALDANPPDSRNGITHPHVDGQFLCAGDASAPVAHALSEGRLCDAFLLVQSVLNTYNAGSAYVTLNDWEGESCSSCDRTMSSDDSYSCDGCLRSVCDECIGHCERCAESRCGRCLERDFYTDETYCSGCSATCGECGHIVARSRFDPKTLMCSVCVEERKEQEAAQEELEAALADETSKPSPGELKAVST